MPLEETLGSGRASEAGRGWPWEAETPDTQMSEMIQLKKKKNKAGTRLCAFGNAWQSTHRPRVQRARPGPRGLRTPGPRGPHACCLLLGLQARAAEAPSWLSPLTALGETVL